MTERIRVVIVDDQHLFARSLKVVLESYSGNEIEVVGIAHEGREALNMVGNLSPAVVLMDVRMPEMDGVEATQAIHAEYPDVRIMMLTTFADDDYVVNALSGGAVGYILKDIEPEELVTAVRAVHGGAVLMSQSVGSRLLSSIATPSPNGTLPSEYDEEVQALRQRFPQLNRREAEVLNLICKNLSNHEIADRLFIAEQTVKNYVSKIYAKIEVDDRVHLLQLVNGSR